MPSSSSAFSILPRRTRKRESSTISLIRVSDWPRPSCSSIATRLRSISCPIIRYASRRSGSRFMRLGTFTRPGGNRIGSSKTVRRALNRPAEPRIRCWRTNTALLLPPLPHNCTVNDWSSSAGPPDKPWSTSWRSASLAKSTSALPSRSRAE